VGNPKRAALAVEVDLNPAARAPSSSATENPPACHECEYRVAINAIALGEKGLGIADSRVDDAVMASAFRIAALGDFTAAAHSRPRNRDIRSRPLEPRQDECQSVSKV